MSDGVIEAHRALSALLGPHAEPADVLLRAEEHRRYWRPRRVRVVLLGESHVYTTPAEMERTVCVPSGGPVDLPRGFVRLVYCLGYGENRLLNRPIASPPNTGTPQFWKIFFACLHTVYDGLDFAPVQSALTPPATRVANKLALLTALRDAGVWLLDASVAALYIPGRGKPAAATVAACVQTSWDAHVGYMVEESGATDLVCIGRGVAHALASRLSALQRVRVTTVPQPNARLSTKDHFDAFKTYRRIVSEATAVP